MKTIISIPHFSMRTNVRQIVYRALDEFWDVVAKSFSGATSGDLSPEISMRLTIAAEEAVCEWVRCNARRRLRRRVLRHFPQRNSPTPGPWFVDQGSPYATYCVKPIPGRIVCDIDGTDAEAKANAIFISAAPDLKAVVEFARIAFEDHLAGLREERSDHQASGADLNGINERIVRCEALILRCDAALKKTTTGNVPGLC